MDINEHEGGQIKMNENEQKWIETGAALQPRPWRRVSNWRVASLAVSLREKSRKTGIVERTQWKDERWSGSVL